jgi:hypothetical protein
MTDELMIEDDVVTPKTDFYIKLDSEADMPTVLSVFYKQDYTTVVDEETGVESIQIEGDPYLVSTTADYSIDVVGVLHEATGVTLTDDEGFEYPEMAALDGWHINIRIRGGISNKDPDDTEAENTLRDDVEALDVSHGVTPAVPKRVWL